MKKKIIILGILLGIIAGIVYAQSEPDTTIIPDNTRFERRFIPERRPDNRTTDSGAAGAIWFNSSTRQWMGDTGVGLFNFNTSGLIPTFPTQAANTVFAGPTSGAAALPNFRALLEVDIPNLSTGKITTGVFDILRIPDLPASKITTGTFVAARIPNLNTIATGLINGCVQSSGGLLVSTGIDCGTAGGGGGSVTSISAGNFSPLFNTNVSSPTTTPNLTFSAISQPQNLVYASPDGTGGTPLFRSLVPLDIPSLDAGKITSGTFAAAQIPSLDASKITTGIFSTAQIPNLDASKITSGTFSPTQIPNLDASKITTGTFNTAQIPNLDASKITSGLLDVARIPNLDATKITTGTFTAARIPDLDATKITTGVFTAARIPALNTISTGVIDGCLTSTGGVLSSTGAVCGTGGGGGITSFSAGNMPPVFTTSVSTPSTTPNLTFNLSNQSATTVLAGPVSGTSAPTFRLLVPGDIPALPASKITSGTFAVAQIPNLDASKIVSGVFSVNRIPNLDASKITAGILDPLRIPNLDASKITTGTFASARIPALNTIVTGVADGCLQSTGGVLQTTSTPCGAGGGGGSVISFGANDLSPLFTVNVTNPTTTPNLSFALVSQAANLIYASPNGASGDPTFRALVAADIPNLDAAKITTGTFLTAQIPDLDAAKITTGVFVSARIPNLDAAKITTGIFAVGRIPALNTIPTGLAAGCVQVAAGLLTSTGTACGVGGGGLVSGSTTYDPPSLPGGVTQIQTVTVTTAVMGDGCVASFSLSLSSTRLSCEVTAANTATVTHFNSTGATVDLASGTLKVVLVR